jgi:hypothetical protein
MILGLYSSSKDATLSSADTIRSFMKRPTMFVHTLTYETATSFLLGYQTATDGGALVGFREWLVLKTGRWTSLAWPGLALYAAFPDCSDPFTEIKKLDANQHAIELLFTMLNEFLDERDKHDALSHIYAKYVQWTSLQETQVIAAIELREQDTKLDCPD